MATTASSYPLARERNLILVSLLVLAAVAWGVVAWQSVTTDHDDHNAMQVPISGESMAAMDGDEQAMGTTESVSSTTAEASEDNHMGLTMGMGVPLFLAIWVAMMVAMMFPTAAPMILMFNRVHGGKRERGQPFVPTWVFVSSYLLVWTLFGAIAYGIAVGVEDIADRSEWIMDNAARLGGSILVLAGLYQLSPLKHLCLSKCRTPLNFILSSWRDGYGGSFRMGLEHGMYCLGCCWLLFCDTVPAWHDEHRSDGLDHVADLR